MDRQRRLRGFREVLQELNIDGFLFTRRSSLRYFTGFSGSSGIAFLSFSDAVFVSDFRYRDQMAREVQGFQVHLSRNGLFDGLRELAVLRRGQKIGFEAEHLSVASLTRLREKFPDVEWVPQEKVVEFFCMVKEEEEIGRLAEAARMADEIFAQLLNVLRPGVKERDIAAEILALAMRKGAEKSSFDPIVLSGPRSAMPHGRAGDRELQSGDFVVLDFGCVVDGYYSDLTRTVVIGRADDRQKEIYRTVYEAQARARAAVRAGIPANKLDAVARDFICQAGFGEYFGHSLGHGLGLEVHAEPRIGPKNDRPLPENAVITIEPGVYITGLGGVRIEDDVVVRRDGGEVLTCSPRELLEIL
jgi:Xaa-Pro aminopeptidase